MSWVLPAAALIASIVHAFVRARWSLRTTVGLLFATWVTLIVASALEIAATPTASLPNKAPADNATLWAVSISEGLNVTAFTLVVGIACLPGIIVGELRRNRLPGV